MKTVAIICEYNPLHNGHLYHIKKIREDFGENTRIVAIMSGNYTQRGEPAIADKALRAKCAVMCGINLVLELPFPFSISSAECFAQAGVYIANEIGADILSFGSENGDIDVLNKIADIMLTDEYKSAIDAMTNEDGVKAIGYPELCERALRSIINKENITISFTPNNILAIEYIKAIKKASSNMLTHTVKRCGASFDEKNITDDIYQSASAIRAEVLQSNISALNYTPNLAKQIYLDAYENGEIPCRADALDNAVISFFRLNPPELGNKIHDAKGGLYNRLRACAFETNNIQTLTELTETKKFTKARIRRAIWYSYFGVTSSEVRALPLYTQLLATDEVGRSLLKEGRKRRHLVVLTKPSALDKLDENTRRQVELSNKADSVFQLTKPRPPKGTYALTFTPYVKK